MSELVQPVFLNLGDTYFGEGEVQVETLLGSCIAIILWHPQRRLGGMCHFVLPKRPRPADGQPLDGRYGDEALMILLEQVRLHHSAIDEYTVKVFGGGNVLGLSATERRIGPANAEFVLAILQRWKIRVAAQDLAGQGYRYVRFDLRTGDIWIRHGKSLPNEFAEVKGALG
jgi:chemotaxis protein CheD